MYIYIYIYLFVDSIFSMDVHSWFYVFSILFFDISMPLLESMLLSLLLTPVEIEPSRVAEKERTQRNK